VRIVIDLSGSAVRLHEPDDFTRFSVVLEGQGDLAQVLAQVALGRLAPDGEHVVVDPGALRVLADRHDERWEDGFAGMCAYAAGKGWVEPDGGIQAHIEGTQKEG
jgi:hypothetical protein